MRCRMMRDDVQCKHGGVGRFVPVPLSLAGAQDKMVVRMVVLCDRCWADWQRSVLCGRVNWSVGLTS